MIKPEDIIQVEFSRAVLGYDMKEVDTLLDAVIEQMEAWEKERSEMLTALEYLLREIERYELPEGEKPVARVQAAAVSVAAGTGELPVEKTEPKPARAERSPRGTRTKSDRRSHRVEAPQKNDDNPSRESAETAMQDTGAATQQAAHAEEFEIPTYVFAGTQDAEPEAPADLFRAPQEGTKKESGLEEAHAPILEEFEIVQAVSQDDAPVSEPQVQDVPVEPQNPISEEQQA